jgi:hypothetical protein
MHGYRELQGQSQEVRSLVGDSLRVKQQRLRVNSLMAM